MSPSTTDATSDRLVVDQALVPPRREAQSLRLVVVAKRTYPQSEFAPPVGSTRFVLIRHGQSMPGTHGERFELVDGHGNPPLSPRGLWQAQQVSARLVDHQIDALYASSLGRTQETAAPLAAAKGMGVIVEHDLREVFLGIGEGGRFREMVHEEHPAIQQLRANRDWGEIPEAETNLELTERVIPVLETLHQTHLNQTIAVFCHGGVIGAAVAHVLNVNAYRMSGVRNGSISEIVRTPSDWILRSFNDASHVGSLFQDHDPPGDHLHRAEDNSA